MTFARATLFRAGVCVTSGLALVASCATPTSLTVQVYSEVPCNQQAAAVIVTASSLSELPSSAPSSASTKCDADGKLGSVVIAPGGTKDATIAFAVMTRPDGQSADACLDPTRASGCIVAKRRLRFERHTEIDMRLDLRLSCLGVQCTEDQTCVAGACVAADIQCGSSCDESALLTPGFDLDGGVVPEGGAAIDAALAPEGGTDANAVLPVANSRNAIALGTDHACVLLETGQVSCWGANGQGQLGDGTFAARNQRAFVAGITNATAVAAGGAFSCAIVDAGRVVCWGANARGQLGDATGVNSPSLPREVKGIAGAWSLALGEAHACAARATGGGAIVECWGANDQGQLGNGELVESNVPVPVTEFQATTATVVGAGREHSCAADGVVVSCWGNNQSGQLGDDTRTSSRTPVSAPNSTAVAGLGLGAADSCLVTSQGPGSRIRCWGANTYGQLGDGTTVPRSTPVGTTAIFEGSFGSEGGTAFTAVTGVAVAMGNDHACALESAGRLMCWGRNQAGQLGDGVVGDRLSPVIVPGVSGLVAIAARGASTCVSTTTTVRCFGTAATWTVSP